MIKIDEIYLKNNTQKYTEAKFFLLKIFEFFIAFDWKIDNYLK